MPRNERAGSIAFVELVALFWAEASTHPNPSNAITANSGPSDLIEQLALTRDEEHAMVDTVAAANVARPAAGFLSHQLSMPGW